MWGKGSRESNDDRWAGIVKQLLTVNAEQAARAEDERRSLLDRIQHPERQQVVAADPSTYEAPEATDAAELAQVGQIVPEFVNVGSHDDAIGLVGQILEAPLES
jgi:hypothetical protein